MKADIANDTPDMWVLRTPFWYYLKQIHQDVAQIFWFHLKYACNPHENAFVYFYVEAVQFKTSNLPCVFIITDIYLFTV